MYAFLNVKFVRFSLFCLLALFHNNVHSHQKFILAIDIGHTKLHPGATSARGKKEYFFNREIADILYKKTKDYQDIEAFIINPDGTNISLQERTKIADNKNADLFISLHHDSVQAHYLRKWHVKKETLLFSDNFRGYSIFISKKNSKTEASYRFAKILGNELRKLKFIPTLHHAEKISGENRKLLDRETGIYEFNDLLVLKKAPMAAILLECGIIVNRKEEALVQSEDYKNKLSTAIIHSILEYKKTLN